MEGHSQLVSFTWSVADLLRGDYKKSEYGRVILPLTVLRRLDCVLEATKPAVLGDRLGVRPMAVALEGPASADRGSPITPRATVSTGMPSDRPVSMVDRTPQFP